jgi:ATP-dependent Clp protease protease subunit
MDWMKIKNQTDESADLYFYGDIVSSWWGAWDDTDQYPESIKNFLDGVKGKNLNIYVNSGGGSVFAGIAIYNMLKRHQGNKTVYVDGLAASIASVIALAGDKVVIPSNAFMMIHKPWNGLMGNANDFRKMANDLDAIEEGIINVYAENLKDGVDIETIRQMVQDETWLNGLEAANYFNIEVTQENTVAACISEQFKNYTKVPQSFLAPQQQPQPEDNINDLLMELDLI